jgi:putative transposase
MVGEGIAVEVACRVLAVSVSGYYAWLSRPPSARTIRHAWLTDLITEVHQASRGIYGARRVHAELRLGRGVVVGHGAVELLMRRAGLRGATDRHKRRRTRPDEVATDLVDRQFRRTGPNQLWITDITEHPTREGKVYCAVVLDAYSRRVVGWSIDSSPTGALVTNALGMAIDSRTPPAGAVIHSDQGTQFGSWVFTQRAKESGLLPSMGSVGDCYDTQSRIIVEGAVPWTAPAMWEARSVGSQPAAAAEPCDRWNASSYSRGGMFPHQKCSLSVLYHATHSMVAMVTSMTFFQSPRKSISSFL